VFRVRQLYRSVLGQNERIEIDLNFIFRAPFAGIETLQLWQPGELDRPHVRVVGLMELIIGKMLALLERGAVRDVWDVANLTEQVRDVLKERSFRARFHFQHIIENDSRALSMIVLSTKSSAL